MEDIKAVDAPCRSWFQFWCKFALFTAIFFAVILTTLSLLGGKSDTLKSGVEQFFTRASGYPAHVETLNGLHFFPDFRLDINGLGISDKDGSAGLVVQLHSLKIAMGFWDMILHTGDIESLDLEGLRFAPGYLHPGEIALNRLAIIHPKGKEPMLEGNGTISGTPWFFRLNLESVGQAPVFSYHFGERRGFSARLGALEAEGTLINEGSILVVDGFSLKQAGKLFLRGRPSIEAAAGQSVKLGGALELAGQEDTFTNVTPDITAQYQSGKLVLSGTLASSNGSAAAAFEALRQQVQKLAGYPLKDNGQAMLLRWPLEIKVTP